MLLIIFYCDNFIWAAADSVVCPVWPDSDAGRITHVDHIMRDQIKWHEQIVSSGGS